MEDLSIYEIYKRGHKHHKKGEYERAKFYLEYGANKGDLECMHLLSRMLFQGEGIQVDKARSLELLKTAADKGHVKSMLVYAKKLINGDGIEMNQREGLDYLTKAAELGSKEAYFQIGELSYMKPDTRHSASFFYKKAADLGHVDSMFLYARMVQKKEADADDDEYNPNDHITYYKMASEHKHFDAMWKYGKILYYGRGVECDTEKAIELFKEASDQGNVKSLKILADIEFDNGNFEGFKRYSRRAAFEGGLPYIKSYIRKLHSNVRFTDKEEEALFTKKGADMGDEELMYKYAEMLNYGIGVEQSEKKASNYYKMAAKKGYPLACSKYGTIKRYGKAGKKANREKALNYFLKGVEQDDRESIQYAGEMYFLGEGVTVDVKKAESLLKRVADDNSNVSFEYGTLLFRFGSEKGDKEKGLEYIKKAADGNSTEAMFVYGNIHYQGMSVDVDKETAFYYFSQSALNGDVDGMICTGKMLCMGDGIPQNLEESAKFFKMAADKGNEFGQQNYDYVIEQIKLSKNPPPQQQPQQQQQQQQQSQQQQQQPQQQQPQQQSPPQKVEPKKEEKPSMIINKREYKDYLKEGKYLLRVKIFDAHLTPPKDTDAYSNPFIMFDDCKTFSCHSSVFQNTLNPVWNETFDFYVNEDTDMKVIFASGDGSYKYIQLNQGYHIKLSEHKVGDHGCFNQKCYYSLTPCMGTLHFEYDILEGNLQKSQPKQESPVKRETQQTSSYTPSTSPNKDAYKTIKLNLDDERDWKWGYQFYK